MTGSLINRFSVLPQMQEERQIESSFQANQAEQLKFRLEETKSEAERAMREEMDRTRQLELKVVQNHPRMREWMANRAAVEQQDRDWRMARNLERQQWQQEGETLEHQINFKKQQLNQLNEEQSRQRKLQEEIGAQQSRLRAEIDDARRGEADAMARLNSVKLRLEPLQEQFNDLEIQMGKALRRQQDLQAEHSMQEHNRDELAQRYVDVQHELGPLLGQVQEYRQRHNKSLEDVARAREVVQEAKAACDEHHGIFYNLEASVAGNEKKVREAHEAGESAMDLKRRTGELLEGCRAKLDGVRAEKNGIVERRRDIDAQISRLIREKYELQTQLDSRLGQEKDLGAESDCLQADMNRADECYRAAVEFQDRLNKTHGQVREAFNSESRLIKQLMTKKNEAEQELREAQSIYEAVGRELGTIEPRLGEREMMLGDIGEKRDYAAAGVNRVENELMHLKGRIDEFQSQMMRLESTLAPLLEEQGAATGVLNNCTNVLRSLKRRWEDTESRLDEVSSGDLTARQERLSSEIGSMMSSIDGLRGKVHVPDANPALEAELARLEAQKSAMINQIRDDLKNNPPAALTDQLSREAEAVMRAELAAGLCARQARIEDEAKDLASLHPSTQPRITLDHEAAKALTGQHFDNPNYHDIASLVVELTEKRHIAAQ